MESWKVRWSRALALLVLCTAPTLISATTAPTGNGQQADAPKDIEPTNAPRKFAAQYFQAPLLLVDENEDETGEDKVVVDTKQELVDQALSILRTIEEPTLKTKRKKDQQTGIITIIAQQLRRFLLLHEAQSQEETPEALEAKSDGSKASRKLRLAVEGLETAARVGNSDALFLLAEMNFYGNYTHPRNYKTAFERYKELADLTGNSTAQHMVGFIYATGIGNAVERDQAKSMLYHTFAALAGNTRSEMTLGFRYRTGVATPRNCDSAVLWYKRAADKAMEYWLSGAPGGRFLEYNAYRLADDVGGVYGQGASVSSSGANAKRKGMASTDSASDLEDILDYWQMMAVKQDLLSMYGLGKLYYDGSRVLPRNFAKARYYFNQIVNLYWDRDGKVKKSAAGRTGLDKFASRAAGQLGRMYMRGDGVKPDYEKAHKWFKRGAAGGDMVSQNGLGFMHLNGYGVPQSNQVAADWFKLSAEQGFPAAQSNLGKLLYDTKLKKDLIIATDYFELAAKQGILEAQYYLAEIYNAEGLGRTCSHAVVYYKNVVERVEATQSPLGWALRSFENGDIESAIVGYMMAAEQGYEAAQANVAYLLDQDKSVFKPAEWLHLLPASLRNSKLLPLALPTASHANSPSPYSTANQQDNKTAELTLVYWTRSAKQNNMDSFVKMGDYYYRGIGLPNSQPDVEKAVQCYQVASQFQQSAQALWNLGYMYENGIGMKQDFHLAKRFYDQAMEANVEAYLPVTLSLLKLRVRSLWNTITGGDINPIGPDDSEEDRPSPRTLLEQLFNLRPNPAYPPGRAEDDDLLPFDNDNADGVEGATTNTRNAADDGEAAANGDFGDGWDWGDDEEDELIENMVILGLVALAGLYVWYRQQRRVAQERAEGGQGNGQEALGDQGLGGVPGLGAWEGLGGIH